MLNPHLVRPSTPSTPPVNQPKRRSAHAPKRPWRGVILSLVVVFGLFAYGQIISLRNSIFVQGAGSSDLLSYDPSKSLDWNQFQKPGDGRYNVLILGIGGITDTGQVHDGSNLTDSIQVLSMDTVNKKLSYTSIPRDFSFPVVGHGPAKINSVYSYAEADQPGSGGQAAKQAVGKVLGITIQSFVVVDFTAAREVIDTLGGLDINVPNAISDPEYPAADEIHFDPLSIPAGMQHMDGDLALKYMRTRHADNDYGRSARQQQVLAAAKEKALSLGVLSNPVTVSKLLTTLGKHVRTDLSPDTAIKLVGLTKNYSQDPSNVLDATDQLGLLKEALDPVAGFIVYPLVGKSNYSQVQEWFAKQNPDPFIAKEGASITLSAASSVNQTKLQAFADHLKAYGFQVTVIPAPDGLVGPSSTQIYAKHSDKPVTKAYLTNLLAADPLTTSPLHSGADFELIYTP